MKATLHYIYDPLCGWCYGAEPLVTAAADIAGLDVALHAGGLWPEPTRLPAETRRYIEQADARIAATSGQPFGAGYLSGLLHDPTMVLDSSPPIAAILAVQSVRADAALPMLRAIQRAHYVEGRRVVELDVLRDLAASCGVDRGTFETAFAAAAADAHIDDTRQLMHRVGSQGFPTFALEKEGRLHGVAHQRFAGAAGAFREWLENEIGAERPSREPA